MLRQRIVSALIMIPLVVVAVLQLDQSWFALLIASLVLLAAWEWCGLVPLHGRVAHIAYLVFVLALIVLGWRFAQREVFVNLLLWLSLGWWLFVLFWITRPTLGGEPTAGHALAKSLLGAGLLLGAWVSLVVLHSRPDQGPHWVLYMLVLVWVADSGAFFAGRQFGRNKLAPQVSPGKTWEGVFGALIACAIFAFSYAQFIELHGAMLAAFVLVSMVTVLFSIAGDLLESLLKRQSGLKDSGTLIPGHGGVLDRIDSLLAAAPVFLFGLRWIDL